MNKIHFYKFDGAGNDFVLVDARQADPRLSADQIAQICHRRFGVGADGLMTLGVGEGRYAFKMLYYNSDGRTADMCGNGGRCIAMFAFLLGLAPLQEGAALEFLAADGPHRATLKRWDSEQKKGVIALSMRDVPAGEIAEVLDGYLLNTGVPHFVLEVQDLDHYDVASEGRRLRFHPSMGEAGANVNFVERQQDGTLKVRTYERGVEDETWACGTGVTACAIVTGCGEIHARGGDFEVAYCSPESVKAAYTQVVLTGPVSLNFEGDLEI